MPTPSQFEHLTDGPVGDQGLDALVTRTEAGLEGHRQLAVSAVERVDDGVARGQVGREWLFAEDAEGSVLDTRQHHVLVAIEPARGHHNELGFLALQHGAIVLIGPIDPQAPGGGGSPGFVLVGNGDHLEFGLVQDGEVESVAVVSSACTANHRGAIRGSEHVTVSGKDEEVPRWCPRREWVSKEIVVWNIRNDESERGRKKWRLWFRMRYDRVRQPTDLDGFPATVSRT